MIAPLIEMVGDPGQGVPVALVAGLPGATGAVPFVIDGGRVRVLAPSRSPLARSPDLSTGDGQPSLSTIIRQAAE